MKKDEYNLLLSIEQVKIPKKRYNYIIDKWEKQKWIENKEFTREFFRIKDLALNKKKYIYQWDGRVVIVNFIEDTWKIGSTIGIIEDHGDNGWYLYTKNANYFLDQFKDIAYVDLHPKPNKIWQKLNFAYWKRFGISDRFHKKITEGSYGTICDYSRMKEGIFTYSHPEGKIGDCFPYCQCKFLEKP